MENRNSDKLLRNLQIGVLALLILYFGRTLFIPMCYGLLVSIVLFPLSKWLEKRAVPRAIAIAAGLSIVTLLFAGLFSILLIEINLFRKDLPVIITKLNRSMGQFELWISTKTSIPASTTGMWWKQLDNYLATNGGTLIKETLAATTGTFFTAFLIPVFAALFLYNRQTFVAFLLNVTNAKDKELVLQKLDLIIGTYFHFIKGTIIVYLIVGVLNSLGLMALGIKHAILFGMLTAVMTIIPYVGIIISALLPISVAWLTKSSIWYPIGVIALFALVQYLEANVIFPKIVAHQLKVSTWATLVVIIAGGLLWGVSGMILFIPFLGFAKVAIDLKPEWNSLKILISD